MAVNIAGAVAIEVVEDEALQVVVACMAGDVALIQAKPVYRVRNRLAGEPLVARVFRAEESGLKKTTGSIEGRPLPA